MDLREEFKKENGYGVMAVRQDYAGQRPYEDGFCDEYVEWLEAKVEKLSLHNVSNRYSIEDIEKCVENWGICKVEKEYIERFLNGC